MYQLTSHPYSIKRLTDGAFIPSNEPLNRDSRKYMAWLAEGNIPAPADPIPETITINEVVEALWAKVVNGDESLINKVKERKR